MEKLKDMPLSGIKVIELANVVAAPSASEMLCAYGAEVIKVEAASGDILRRSGEQLDIPCEDYRNPIFTMHNNGKKLISIDLKKKDGKEALMKLLEDADIFITNMRLQPLKNLGFNYKALKDRFPRLIFADFSGFGKKGPDARRRAYDATAFWMRSGAVSDWVAKGSVPFTPAYGFGDIAVSFIFLSGILMALVARERTGHGTELSTSLMAGGVWCNGNALIKSQFHQHHNPDQLYPLDMFANYYLCSDGRWLGLFVNNYEAELRKISKLLGIEDIADDPRFESYDTLRKYGSAHEAVLRLNKIFLQKTSAEWKKLLTAHDIACEVVSQINEIVDDEQVKANNFLEEVEFKDGLKLQVPVPPITFSEYTRREIKPTGKIGEDTEQVLKDSGFSDEQIEILKSKKII